MIFSLYSVKFLLLKNELPKIVIRKNIKFGIRREKCNKDIFPYIGKQVMRVNNMNPAVRIAVIQPSQPFLEKKATRKSEIINLFFKNTNRKQKRQINQKSISFLTQHSYWFY